MNSLVLSTLLSTTSSYKSINSINPIIVKNISCATFIDRLNSFEKNKNISSLSLFSRLLSMNQYDSIKFNAKNNHSISATLFPKEMNDVMSKLNSKKSFNPIIPIDTMKPKKTLQSSSPILSFFSQTISVLKSFIHDNNIIYANEQPLEDLTIEDTVLSSTKGNVVEEVIISEIMTEDDGKAPKRYLGASISLGFAFGFISGLALKVIAKWSLLVAGFCFIVVQILAYQGYVKVNWTNVANSVKPELSKDVMKERWQSTKTVLTYDAPFAATFVSGLIVGVRYG